MQATRQRSADRSWPLRQFARAQRGATAVEFALIAPLFLGTLLVIFQVCIYLLAQQALQNAATQAGRLFMTNSGQSLSQAQYKQAICNSYLPTALFSCSNLIVVVQSYNDFASASTTAPALYSNGNAITNFAYSPGAPGQVMVVQLVYPWSVISGPLGFTMANLPGNKAEMLAVTAFRVEPSY